MPECLEIAVIGNEEAVVGEFGGDALAGEALLAVGFDGLSLSLGKCAAGG